MENIIGGLADYKSNKDFDQTQLEIGTKVEMEHTNDPNIAQEIAMDHLTEDPNYYKKLKSAMPDEVKERKILSFNSYKKLKS